MVIQRPGPVVIEPQWQLRPQQQFDNNNNECYWAGVFPNCHTRCDRRDIVVTEIPRPLNGALCQTGRLRYCCSLKGWDRDRRRPNFNRDPRPNQWNNWNNNNGPIGLGLGLNLFPNLFVPRN